MRYCFLTSSNLLPRCTLEGRLPQWLNGKESACNADLQEMWVRSNGREDPLEQEVATYSSNLTWIIPQTEESGELQSMESQDSDKTEWLNSKQQALEGVHSLTKKLCINWLLSLLCRTASSTEWLSSGLQWTSVRPWIKFNTQLSFLFTSNGISPHLAPKSNVNPSSF